LFIAKYPFCPLIAGVKMHSPPLMLAFPLMIPLRSVALAKDSWM
jgi:hypothetical protein